MKEAEESAPTASASSGQEINVKQAVVAHHTTRATAGNTAGEPRLVHNLNSQVLEQAGKLVWPMQSWNLEPASPRHMCSAMAGAR